MGVVYRAFDTLLQRVVAVKVISGSIEGNPDLRERFFREARAAGQLSHRNIITIHDLGEHDARALPRHGVSRGRGSPAPDGGPRPDEPVAQAGSGDRHLPRARLRAHAQRRPSRHQAGEHLHHRQRHGEAARLRAGQARHLRADAQQHDDGHHQLHGARAGARRTRRPPVRHFRHRRGPVRDAERPQSVPGRFVCRNAVPDPATGTRAARPHRSDAPVADGGYRRASARQAAGRALPADERDAARLAHGAPAVGHVRVADGLPLGLRECPLVADTAA